jgi:hypothetical protein
MRKLIAVAVAATAFASVFQNGAEARKQYMDSFKAKYTKVAENNKINCNTCHVGTKKSDRNDYGQALAKATGKDQKDKGKIDEALAKTEKEKNADGKTFGELLEAGKLPGTSK